MATSKAGNKVSKSAVGLSKKRAKVNAKIGIEIGVQGVRGRLKARNASSNGVGNNGGGSKVIRRSARILILSRANTQPPALKKSKKPRVYLKRRFPKGSPAKGNTQKQLANKTNWVHDSPSDKIVNKKTCPHCAAGKHGAGACKGGPVCIPCRKSGVPAFKCQNWSPDKMMKKNLPLSYKKDWKQHRVNYKNYYNKASNKA